MHIQINRDLAIPIYTQLVGHIQFSIVSGHLPSGTRLPSIRELAQEVCVAPMTITQAYQELKQLGLIEMRPGLGTFVADFSVQREQASTPNRSLHLRRMLRRTVAEAKNTGFREDEIRQTFLSMLTDSGSLFASRHFVLVGLFPTALQVYADDLERQLAREQVSVDPVSFDELQSRPDYYLPQLQRAEALLTPLHQVHRLQEVLQSINSAQDMVVLGVSFSLRPSARRAIASLPAGMRIGIVSRFPEFVNTMVQGISDVSPLTNDVVVCISTDADCLQRMRPSVDAIIYATGAYEAIDALRPQLPPDLPLIEYLHTPDANTYQRIRQFLAAEELNVQP